MVNSRPIEIEAVTDTMNDLHVGTSGGSEEATTKPAPPFSTPGACPPERMTVELQHTRNLFAGEGPDTGGVRFESLQGPQVLENGDVLRISDVKIGRGGFGSVHMAQVTTADGQSQDVAVKDSSNLAPADAVTILLDEKKIYEHLPDHPNVTRYLGCSISEYGDQDSFIVLEYLPHNLQYVVFKDEHFKTYRDMLQILRGIALGLEHLHSHNIIHFDLKPSNVLLTKDRVPKIADFGVSKIRANNSITATVRGTYGYMAPELLVGGWWNLLPGGAENRVTDSIDIYSFGMIGYVCATGALIYDDETSRTLIKDGKFVSLGMAKRYQVVCDCPMELRDMINQCLRFEIKDQTTRGYGRPSAAQLIEMIDSMLLMDWSDDLMKWKANR